MLLQCLIIYMCVRAYFPHGMMVFFFLLYVAIPCYGVGLLFDKVRLRHIV